MADFVQKNVVKSALREFAEPIGNVTAFDQVIQTIVTTNPFGCVAYTEGGVTHQPVEKVKEAYVAKVVYQDADAKTVGTENGKYTSIAGFDAGATAILGNADLTAAHGGTPARDTANETWSVMLRCRDANGEIYNITLTRRNMSLTSYSDDAIRAKVETWADTIAVLA
jgi:hypothetical protein